MSLIRTEQISIKCTEELSNLCHISKNLWNEANYLIRQEFFSNNRWIRYAELNKILKVSDNYKSLNAQSAQQTLKLLDKTWISTFAGIKERTKNPEKFKGKVGLPRYKSKNGEAILIFTNQQCKIKDGYLIFPKKLSTMKIKTRLSGKINQVRFIPKGTYYNCEIIYEKLSEKELINKRWYAKRNKNIIGIDYGVANIVTMVNNIGHQPIVIKDDGTGIKSINQFYNKEKSALQSIYDKQGIKHGSKMSRLNNKRNRKIKDAMHKISRFIVDYCVKHDIETISIGHNNDWKQNSNMGKKTNQKFVTIPYNILTQMISYKAEEEGILVKVPHEDHTSKCSFLDNESIEHHEKYLGERFSRGLFKSSNGTIINADVNAGYNIICRSDPNVIWTNGVGGCALHPLSLNLLEIKSNNVIRLIQQGFKQLQYI